MAGIIAALVLVLLGAGGIAAYFLLDRSPPGPVTQAPPTDALPPEGLAPQRWDTARSETPSPPTAPAARPAAVAPPPAVVQWQDVASADGRFAIRFPGKPVTTSKRDGPRETQSFTVVLGNPMSACTLLVMDLDSESPPSARMILDSMAARPPVGIKDKKDINIDNFPGIEFICEETRENRTWTTVQRVYVVRDRTYQLIATMTRDSYDPAFAARFLDSLTIVEKAEPELIAPPEVVVSAEPVRPPVAMTPEEALKALARLEVKLPEGWQGDYNKFRGWTFTRTAPGLDGKEEHRIDVRLFDDPGADVEGYAAKLKQRDFLDFDPDHYFAQITDTQKRPDGFVITGVVKSSTGVKEKPRLGLVMVRDLGGVKLRCASTQLYSDAVRQEAIELFQSARIGPGK
jgi:hypothetical protein